MSFVVKKVYLENFRTHESLEFSPDEKGVTVIKGHNGSGKSSLIDSIAWCLYGVKPGGVSKNDNLRRHHMDLEKEKTLVRVTVRLSDASEYEIERRILGKKGNAECDVWQLIKNADGSVAKEHVAGASVTHASEFILRILGVDEKGFLASMFVQQKQVDELLTSSPKDRSAVIEKMTGITALTDAVSEIRVDLRDAKKAMELYGNDSNDYDIEGLEKEIADKTTQYEQLEKDYKKIVEQGKSAKKEVSELQELHKYQSDMLNKLDKQTSVYNFAHKEHTELKNRLAQSQENLNDKTAQLEKLEESLGDRNAQDVMDDYNAKNKELNNTSYQISDMQNTLSNLHVEIDRGVNTCAHMSTLGLLTKEAEEATGAEKFDLASQNLLVVLEGLDKERIDLSENIKSIKEKLSHNDFLLSSNASTIKALSNEHGECPTCHQKPENLDTLLSDLEKSNALIEKEKEELENEKEKLSGELNSIATSVENINGYIEVLNVSKKSSEGLEEKEKSLEELKSLKEKLEEEVANMQELYSLANNATTVRTNVDSASKECEQIARSVGMKKTEVKEAKSEKEALEEEVKDFGDVVAREAEISEKTENLEELRKQAYEIKSEKGVLENSIEYDNKTLEQAKSSKERYEKSVSTYEKVASSAKIVSSFRENRIEQVVPEISHSASSLLERFTEGKFVSMHLDKSYKAHVVQADGVKVDVGMLSGGELSAVALSLRLAIAMISHKGNSNSTMILDEVLVSQDENRVENIVNTIKEVLDGQVILIGHNGDVISSIADNIVELT